MLYYHVWELDEKYKNKPRRGKEKFIFCLLLVTGDLESTLKHCCRQGRKEERCTNISTPMRDVASEHLGMCLTAMEICCVEAERSLLISSI
jgi:hypothetical protein